MELIKLEMTPKERAAAYARGEEVDRIPTTLSASETISPLYGIRICDYYFSSDLMFEIESNIARDFHADNMGIGLGLRALVEAMGAKIAYPETGVSFIEKPGISDFSDVDNLELVKVDKDGRLPIIIEAMKKLQDKFGHERNIGSGLAGPLTTAAELIGTETFLRGTMKNKEGVHRLMQYATDSVVKCCEDMNRILGIKFMLSEPIASRELLSKKQFREFFLPYLKQAVERMNKFQGGTGIHICGRTRDRWEDVVDAGISGFWIDNCESLKELKELYGDLISITGNVSPVDIISHGRKEDIAAGVRKCIEEGADNPCGYTLCPGCTTPVGTSKENIIAYMNAASTYGRGARKGHLPKGITEIMS